MPNSARSTRLRDDLGAMAKSPRPSADPSCRWCRESATETSGSSSAGEARQSSGSPPPTPPRRLRRGRERWNLDAGPRRKRGMTRRHDHDFRLCQPQTMGQFGRRKPPVLACDDRPEPRRGQKQLQIFQAVLRQDRDARAPPHPAPAQPRRQTAHAFTQRRVGDPALAIHQRQTFRTKPGRCREQAGDRAGSAAPHKRVQFKGSL